MATSLAQDFSVLRPGGARGGFPILRALREEGEGPDRAAMYIADEVFATQSRQRLDTAMQFETSWFDFALKVRAKGMRLTRALARRTASPTDLPTLEDVPAQHVPMLPDTRRWRKKNRAWDRAIRTAHAWWVSFCETQRLALEWERWDVIENRADALVGFLKVQLREQEGVWADLRDCLLPLERKLAAWPT